MIINRKYNYPFTAIVGQEKVKRALIINAVNPKAGGVLIVGQKGTAKSTLARGLENILDNSKIVELPLNATEDRVVGSIDLKSAVTEGEKVFNPGILHEADGSILYIDEVNLLSQSIINTIMDVSASGVNSIEREGISYKHKSQFILIGTMNPEEGTISSGLLDRFGLYVEVKGEMNINKRVEIIKRRLAYESDAKQFCADYESDTKRLKEKVCKAKQTLKKCIISDEILKIAVNITKEANCQGHRADIFLIETAKAVAALDGRTKVNIQDIKEAAFFVIPHRMNECKDNLQSSSKKQSSEENSKKDESQNEQSENYQQNSNIKASSNIQSLEQNAKIQTSEKVYDIGNIFDVRDILIDLKDKNVRKGNGKRSKTRTNAFQGRYVKAVIPTGKPKDIAVDATLRVAAINSKLRSGKNEIKVRESDLRERVRERRIGNTLIFIVDSSGSMGAKQRMRAVKGAVISLLNDAYQKRDKVGMIAFRKDTAKQLLPVTRSVDMAQRMLKNLPTGGKTPLAAGLIKGYTAAKSILLKDKNALPVIILISDGRANNCIAGKDPIKEALKICEKISYEGIKSLVIDTESGFIKLGLAEKLAQKLGAKYYKLEQLRADNITTAVKDFVG